MRPPCMNWAEIQIHVYKSPDLSISARKSMSKSIIYTSIYHDYNITVEQPSICIWTLGWTKTVYRKYLIEKKLKTNTKYFDPTPPPRIKRKMYIYYLKSTFPFPFLVIIFHFSWQNFNFLHENRKLAKTWRGEMIVGVNSQKWEGRIDN